MGGRTGKVLSEPIEESGVLQCPNHRHEVPGIEIRAHLVREIGVETPERPRVMLVWDDWSHTILQLHQGQ